MCVIEDRDMMQHDEVLYNRSSMQGDLEQDKHAPHAQVVRETHADRTCKHDGGMCGYRSHLGPQ